MNISYSRIALAALSLCTICSGIAAADDRALRSFIGQQVGGIKKLQVPATDASIPVPPPPPPGSGLTPDRFVTTEAKRFLGKLLFHDPVRTARININQGQPVDLPAGTAFGGTVNGFDPNVAAIVAATKQTGSCGSCHIGEAAGKAGQQITCTSALRAAATPTRTATSSLAVGPNRSLPSSAPRPSSPATCWSMRSRR